MPAMIAHLMLCEDAFERLKQRGGAHAEFANQLRGGDATNSQLFAYAQLGCLGPDLFYFCDPLRAAKNLVADRFIDAEGIEPWSYQLHSQRPNVLPLKLMEITWRDANRRNGKVDLEERDFARMAFIGGYLTHIAGDQIIHPLVNSIAGPYYREGSNRRKHRECEAFQDYYIYEYLRETNRRTVPFSERSFDVRPGCVRASPTYLLEWLWRRLTDLGFPGTWLFRAERRTMFPGASMVLGVQKWFRYFLQRGFVEAYGSCPSNQEIDDSIANALLVLKKIRWARAYKRVIRDYAQSGKDSTYYKEYFEQPDYAKAYDQAAELAEVYLLALDEVYAKILHGNPFDDTLRDRFLSVVQSADLSCPLDHDIVKTAGAAMEAPSAPRRTLPAAAVPKEETSKPRPVILTDHGTSPEASGRQTQASVRPPLPPACEDRTREEPRLD